MHRSKLVAVVGVTVLALGVAGCGDDSDSEDESRGDDSATTDPGAADAGAADAELVAPEDGAEVTSPVEVEMAAEGVEIVEAGEPVEGEGHFHVIVDEDCIEPGEVIPSDDSHVHFGDASTSAEIELEPGEHSLCLQVGDGTHIALDGTDEVDITVVG